MPRPHWRKMTWVLILWCALILIWAIAGGNDAQNSCNAQTQLEQDACDAGTGIGVAIVLLIGFFGFVFFGLIWFMTRPKGRDCPVCGELVKKGRTQCAKCGYDFTAVAFAGASGGGPAAFAAPQSQAPAQVEVPAGWFADPQGAANERYWDGIQWTEHVRGDGAHAPPAPTQHQIPAGWFPDPNQQGLERYWDGVQWTQHVRQDGTKPAPQTPRHQEIPAGWFPDPHKQASERYWDGVQWTDQVRA